jgi:hypothetical protein
MGELLIFLLIVWVLWFFRARIQVWLLSRILRRVQRRMDEASSSRGYGSAERDYRQGQRTGTNRQGDAGADFGSPQKQELDTIEARKFERSSTDEYVDFEELPKE